MPESLFPWFELPWQMDCRGMIAALSEMESGAKIRTGGTAPDAHPTPLQLARFLVACHQAGVPFKATAGLHHPFRHHSESVGCEQHGFVNVFFGAALLHHGVVELEELEMLLGETHAKHFEFTPTSVAWKGRALGIAQIREARKKFGPDTKLGKRRTTFDAAPKAEESVIAEAMIEREPVTVVVSRKGWIRALKGHVADVSSVQFKGDDGLMTSFFAETT